jgi:hypothetical protein
MRSTSVPEICSRTTATIPAAPARIPAEAVMRLKTVLLSMTAEMMVQAAETIT